MAKSFRSFHEGRKGGWDDDDWGGGDDDNKDHKLKDRKEKQQRKLSGRADRLAELDTPEITKKR